MSTTSNTNKRAKTYKKVEIHWGDAFLDTDDFDLEDAINTTPVYRKTVGFLVVKNRHGYILATDTFDSDPKLFHAKMFIPKGMVYKVTDLTVR